MREVRSASAALALAIGLAGEGTRACTNFLISGGASAEAAETYTVVGNLNEHQVAQAILAVFEARGLQVEAALREKILAVDDPKKLESWLVKAATATAAAGAVD